MSTRRLLAALLPAATLLLARTAIAQDGPVVFERTGYRLTSLGARIPVSARVLDAQRRPLPRAPIIWRIQDSTIASVNARGEVISRRVGRTRVWAVSGRDSASALILVDQWAARFTFNPPVLRFDAVDERRMLQVQARDASGNVIPGVRSAVACRVVNDRIATLAPSGQVQARTTGTTYLRCADRGVADSVRIDVRQRPVRAAIADKGAFGQKQVGDTFSIRMSAADAEGRAIFDARPTWASLDPRVVNIDPLTGRARAVGPGAAKIVGQVGDITDTVAVTVAAALGMVLPSSGAEPEAAAAAPEPTASRATLRMFASAPSVGDTTRIDVDVRGAGGAVVDVNSVRFRSSDTSVMKSLGGGRIAAVKVGGAYLVGAFAGMTDSALITVQAKGARASIALAGSAKFVRPSYDTAAARTRNRQQVDSARNAILSASPIRTAASRYLSMAFIAGPASHADRLTNAIVESRSGLLYGGRGTLVPLQWLALSGEFLTGTLVGEKTSPIEDLAVTQMGGNIAMSPVPAVTLRAGYTARAQSTPTAVAQWRFADVGLLTRLQFVGGRVGVFAGMSVLPMGTLQENSGKTRKADPTSLSAETGLEMQTGFLNAALGYYVERFTFPIENNVQRKDEFSMLRLRLGFQAGR